MFALLDNRRGRKRLMINSVAIIGMGALGLLYADRIKEAGKSVHFVMDEARIAKYESESFTINNREVKFDLVCDKDAKPVDLCIVAVKYTGLLSALDTMRNVIGENTIIMSVMNGINSEEIIGKRYGMDKVIYTVAQGMDAMKFDNSLKFTQMGKIHLGSKSDADRANVETVKHYFDSINMPYYLEEDILWRMWFKFMLNVGVNQICMAYACDYGKCTTAGTEEYAVMVAVMREVLSIANIKGIKLKESDLAMCIDIEKTLDPKGTPSMGQDRINRKKSEVEMFAGEVIKLGRELGVLVPANEYIYKRVLEIEQNY